MLKTLGVHFIRHPCLTRKLRVLAPAAPKIIPRLLSGRKCSGMSNCGRWGRIVRNFWQALSRILAFAVVWVGASLRRLCATAIVHPLHVYERSVGFASCETLGVHFIRHPCLTRKLRVLAPAAPKSRAMPVCGSGSGAGLSNRACSVGFASCETLGKHYHASLRLRSLGSARPCADSVRQPSCILCTFMNALLVSHRASSAVWVATSCGN